LGDVYKRQLHPWERCLLPDNAAYRGGNMKAKILVVDDEETMRKSLADILRLEGYQVQTLSNGAAAIETIKKETFDLLLLDLKMPGIDGLEVMRSASEITPETMIILLTAHGSLQSAIEAIRNDAFDYLLKPSSPAQIIQSVQSALARRSETVRKRALIEQIDSTLQELRVVEHREAHTSTEGRAVELPGGVMADLARRELWCGEQKITLTPTEGKLLKVLMDNRGRVMGHRELVSMVQGYDVKDWEAPEVLRPLVSRLRQKLSVFPDAVRWIQNVRGTGYVLDF
ncbi:MAG: response regulator transcription factor, partial [Methanotrichaceae archaeon]|nr:response regulator transcription factor [Methanotrichaceae archaeon]